MSGPDLTKFQQRLQGHREKKEAALRAEASRRAMELMDQEERETKNRAAWSRWAGVGLEDLANDSTWDEAELNKRYYINAVNGVLDEMRAAVEGLRNDTLNICAFKIGQLSTGLGFPTEPAAILLGKIAMAKGLGKGEVMATLKSGLAGGMKQPRGRQS